MQLTSFQNQAVKYIKGPLLIIAGAGTGKTTVLVEKINYLIKNNFAKPHEILALTFTDKAAQEMEERVDKMLPYGYFQMWISTFHAFCDFILRQEVAHIGLSTNYILQTQGQSLLYLKKNLFQFDLEYFRPLGNPNKFVAGLLQHFSRLKDEDISSNTYIHWARGKLKVKSEKLKINHKNDVKKAELIETEMVEREKNLELAGAYKKFQELKIKDNVMDFGDLIFYIVKLFRERKNILQKYREQFKYILVDEFQDTNVAQYELIKLLALPIRNPNLTIVGDDSQSIYKFRGAAISNILQFMDDYKKSQKIILLENFRSNQKILDTAYRLIKNNDPDTLEAKLNISKNLQSRVGLGDQSSVQFLPAERVEEEAELTAKEIINLHKNSYHWYDLAILFRANNHAEPFIRALTRFGIPYQFLGSGSLFKQPEIKELIAYLKFLANIADSPSFYRVLTMDIFEIDAIDLARLVAFTKRTNLSLFETMEVYLSFHYSELTREEYAPFKNYLFLLKGKTKEQLFKFYQLIKRSLVRVSKNTAGEILYDFLSESGLLAKLSLYKTEKDEHKALNISRFFDQLKGFETSYEDTSIFSIVDYIEMSMEFGESPAAEKTDKTRYDAVNLLTVHGAKGLEFPIVFLVNLVSDRFPTRARREIFPIPDDLIKEILPEGDYHLEEERRLFYVGLTRAKDKVYLTTADYYSESKRKRKISPFVIEALGESLIFQKKERKSAEKKQLTIFDFEKKESPAFLTKSYEMMSFSFSQIETYNTCPLRYKYQYVLRIPTIKNAAASFGETIHKTLQKFYALFKNGAPVSQAILQDIYTQSWIPIGYTHKAQEKQMKKNGETILKRFFADHHQNDLKILDLEKWFKTKIDKELSIIGKMDRVDLKSDGNLEIIDYKTGKKPDDKELKKSLQMGIYALAVSDNGLYGKNIDQIVLTFYFLQDGSKFSLQKTASDVVELKKELYRISSEINQSQFKPRVGIWCGYCPFKINCEAWQ